MTRKEAIKFRVSIERTAQSGLTDQKASEVPTMFPGMPLNEKAIEAGTRIIPEVITATGHLQKTNLVGGKTKCIKVCMTEMFTLPMNIQTIGRKLKRRCNVCLF